LRCLEAGSRVKLLRIYACERDGDGRKFEYRERRINSGTL
jgi:hypothetical protein